MIVQKSKFNQYEFYSCIVIFHRIIDNMPVTWCYDLADELHKYCSTGFPIGCLVSDDGQAHDACMTSVRFRTLLRQTYWVIVYLAEWELITK